MHTVSIFLFLSFILKLSNCAIGLNDDIFKPEFLRENHPCNRPCVNGAAPMDCYFHFTLQWYHTLSKACYDCPYNLTDCYRPHCISGGGVSRPVIAINRQIPGPIISVCQNDRIVVDLENGLMHEGASIHWHGQWQRETPFMDGVPMLTQCAIGPGTTFRYDFHARQSGTHFWHSHVGLQRGDGFFGALIVRMPPNNDLIRSQYDFDLNDHVMVLQDWEPNLSVHKFTEFFMSNGSMNAPYLLVNGLGASTSFFDNYGNEILTPFARFIVKQGFRYRFRVINAGYLNCPIEISVDDHTMTVIATDGSILRPQIADSLVVFAGERYDFVLNANQQKGLYWIRFRGLMGCAASKAHQAAVLQYEGESNTNIPQKERSYELSKRKGLQVNSPNMPRSTTQNINVGDLGSYSIIDKSFAGTPDFTYMIAYDYYAHDNPLLHYPLLYGYENVSSIYRQPSPQLNYITHHFTSYPFLTQRDQITPGTFCNETTVKNCDSEFCACPHVISLELGALVEIILVDKGFTFDTSHPFHLHGFNFYIVAQEKLGNWVTEDEIATLESQGRIRRNLINPPYKDTVAVPDGGFTIIRFIADNPGYWFMHCHIDFHAELGMAVVFKVGEHEDMVPTPQHFPRCGNYLGEPSSGNNPTEPNPVTHPDIILH